MPEPTVPTPGEDDSTEVTPEHSMPKLQGKSGFDPSAYEADMVARKETTRMQELPPRVRMYWDVITVTKERLHILEAQLRDGTYRGFYERNLLNHDVVELNTLRFKPGSVFSIPISAIGSDKMIIDSVYLPVNYPSFVHPTIQDRKYAFVVVKIQMPNRIEGENLSEQAKDEFIKSEVQLILLSPGERAPILVTTCSQDRYDHENWLPWDEILKSSNHAYFEITDDECEAILTAISTAPIG